MQKPEFIKNPNGPNHVLERDGFTISYNDGSDPNPLGPEPIGGETALIPGGPRLGGKFYILNGDWREAYKELVPSGYAEAGVIEGRIAAFDCVCDTICGDGFMYLHGSAPNATHTH